ncbi:aromatic-ring-hydroxylating dioxygenase subunit beta [Nocardioides soli]|uniref:3-phenylpropionate/cinnamic acid dioxygenase small subunit n=1 Tax=Nocardioides soli TaxID=1036020 RepID=A0A7W4Z3U3_9ACTN|nr:3-phenylpropionate/cinnamic acid dioxygenase small subunit [Nocardioides soli]
MSNDDAVVAFIRHETHLLNSERYDEWLGLLTDDFEYRMPMPVLRDDPTQPRYSDVSLLAWESVRSLTLRFERILTDFAWADRPPAFHRRHLTAVRVAPTEDPQRVAVSSDEIVFRSRVPEGSTMTSALREDVVDLSGSAPRLARRTVLLDQDRPDLAQIALLY